MFSRPVSPCFFFTPQSGLRLFAYPFFNDELTDPFKTVFLSLQRKSQRLWQRSEAGEVDPRGDSKPERPSAQRQKRRAALPGDENSSDTWEGQDDEAIYLRSHHAPQVLDVATMLAVWRLFPSEMSGSLDSAFRHANLTDIVGIHHSMVAARLGSHRKRAVVLDGNTTSEDSAGASTRGLNASEVEDIHMFPDVAVPMGNRTFFEITFRTGAAEEWHEKIAELPPNADEMPQLLSLQDDLIVEGGSTPEADCLREEWLLQLMPSPSFYESADLPPDRCMRFRG